jgi:hypothetical protein
LGDEGVGLSNQDLCQHSAGAFTSDFSQWIVDRFRLTERDDGAISRHGVSLLSGGSGRLDTRLDTPPSIKRRHPDSRIARRSDDEAALIYVPHWKSGCCSRPELNANPVEPTPPRDATPTIAIHLQIEFVRETIGVAHKEQPSSR